MTNQFVKKWIGKKADWDGAYGGQCVDLFRFYVSEVLKLEQPKPVVGAGDFWQAYDSDPILKNNFDKIVNTATFVPQDGDVAIWNKRAGGGFGHIAIVTGSDHTTSYFHSFDQNWSKVSYCEIVKHVYTNLLGVFRPKVQTGAGTPGTMPRKYTEEEMTVVRTERDKNWNLYQTEVEKNVQLAEQLKHCQNSANEKKIAAEVEIAGIAMVINGATKDSNGLVTGNYRIK